MRGAETLHATAFLVDQHRRVGTPYRFTKIGHERAQLVGCLDIALEDGDIYGSASRRNDRSLPVSAVPATPMMKARTVIGAH